MKLVDNPKGVFRSYSFWGMVAGLLSMSQEFVPIWEGMVPDNTYAVMGSIAMTLGLIGRFIEQGIGKPPQ